MAEARVCDNCLMEFDWPGVKVDTYEYCCEACSRGEECTCPQHHHETLPGGHTDSGASNPPQDAR